MRGRRLAADLAADAIPTWLVVDAALPLLLSQARMVWIGADAVTDRGVLNKVGSFALALAAREHSVPVYALATRRKFLPSATPVLRILEMPRDEVWESPPAGVEPRNVYFEQVPLALLTGIVVEDAVLGAGEAATVAKAGAAGGVGAGVGVVTSGPARLFAPGAPDTLPTRHRCRLRPTTSTSCPAASASRPSHCNWPLHDCS